MNVEIIAVGTEILLGDIVNTDAQMISEGLSEIGFNVLYHTVVGDNPTRLRAALEIAKARVDIIITTGGLGPTFDDLTKETLAQSFGKTMELHQPSLDKIVEFFKKIDKVMTPNNAKQAYLPSGCTVLVNDWGTAPGCAFESQGKHVIMLPGPPRECTPMFRIRAMEYLSSLTGGIIKSHTLKIFGMGESEMEDKLRFLMEEMTNPSLAPYAKEGECLVRVTAKAESEAAAEAMLWPVIDRVRDILGDVIYGTDVNSLEEVAVSLLLEKGVTLATAESCTGGLVSKKITDISGSSQIFLGGVCSYSNESKKKLLGVEPETLEKYGAVSEETAIEMANGVRNLLRADMSLSITGIAGPGGGSEEKPVGLVFIALAFGDKTVVKKLNYNHTRDKIRESAAMTGLDMIIRALR